MNLHPLLVSFPVALYCCVLVLECIVLTPAGKRNSNQIRYAIRFNATLCFVGVIAAFLSGYPAGEVANQSFTVPEGLIGDHHLIGRFLLFVSIPWIVLCYVKDLARFNRQFFAAVYYLLLIVGFLLTLYCGYLGGQLVFSHGAGVRIEGV